MCSLFGWVTVQYFIIALVFGFDFLVRLRCPFDYGRRDMSGLGVDSLFVHFVT